MAGAGSSTAVVLLVNRPGSAAIADVSFTELTTYLEVVALYKCQIVIAGDFNIHVEKDNDAAAIRLLELLNSFDCVQNVPQTPAHRDGGTEMEEHLIWYSPS